MTNFEIAVEIDFSLKYTGSGGVLDGLARVSSVLDCSNSAERGSPSFAIACSESNSQLVRLCPGSGISKTG